MERAGIAHTMDEVRDLVSEIEKLKCFPEVPQALARLHARYRLVVLSNGDPDMLEAAKAHHGIAFDRVISVAAANSFKPHVATYTKAAEIEGVRMEEVLSSPTRVRLHRRQVGRCAPPHDRRQAAAARRRISRHDRASMTELADKLA